MYSKRTWRVIAEIPLQQLGALVTHLECSDTCHDKLFVVSILRNIQSTGKRLHSSQSQQMHDCAQCSKLMSICLNVLRSTIRSSQLYTLARLDYETGTALAGDLHTQHLHTLTRMHGIMTTGYRKARAAGPVMGRCAKYSC